MDLLDRLHRQLLAKTTEPSAEGGTPARLTIADLYQRLIPYRLVRAEVGVMELAEYEHALLRLLAGERRYVQLGDQAVTMEFRRELASPHPILGIYRDYAGVEVIVPGEREAGSKAPPASAEPGAASESATLPQPTWIEIAAASLGRASAAGTETAADPAASAPESPDPAAPSDEKSGRRCRQCSRTLPEVPDVLFCPFCGGAQASAPCSRCGATIQADWDFCVRCGASRRARPQP